MEEFLKLIPLLIFMVIAVISSLLKKKRQEDRGETEATSRKGKTVFSAGEDAIKTFLQQVGGQQPEERPPVPPPMPGQAVPAASPVPEPVPEVRSRVSPEEALRRAAAKRRARKKGAPGPRPEARSPERIDQAEPVEWMPAVSEEVKGLEDIGRLPPMQQAVLWREILGPPPGLPESSERKV